MWWFIFILLNVSLAVNGFINSPTLYFSPQEKIVADGYPVETHNVTTEDGYILEMQRIPYSPNNKTIKDRPAIYMQHGLLATADNFVLADRSQAIAYLAADAGFDVWLGNNRGTVYSRKHVKYSTLDKRYWNFSTPEIANFDLPACIDYILETTNQKQLHYLGHSQGTTVYFALLSNRPEYNSKIKSGHVLAPITFIRNAKLPELLPVIQLLGIPDPGRFPFTSFDFLPRIKPVNSLLANLCAQPTILPICLSTIELYVGPTEVHTNTTLIPKLLANFPAGSSFNQWVYFLQLIRSKNFQKFDYGHIINMEKYGSKEPPSYALENITAPTFLYYSNGDYLSSDIDVRFLMESMNQSAIAGTWFDGFGDWNHFDYLAAKDVGDILNKDIIKNLQKYEG